MALAAGSTIGPYQIVAPLGAGGMGEVYRARDPRLGREVALKVISGDGQSDPAKLRRFELEARAASALNHPNILTVYDVGSEGGVSYIVSELVEGQTLRRMIEPEALAARKLLELAVQIADGLAAAHQAGIVHRDLKPENIMVTPESRVKILDFGLAKSILPEPVRQDEDTVPLHTAKDVVMGTASYMSPEQARAGSVDFRSDQFSFGLILYEMATGRRAFARENPVLTLAAILTEEVPALPAKLPPPVRWVIERCLAKEPRQRYGATIDLYHELRNLRDRPLETLTSESPAAAVAPAPSRAKSLAIAGGLALALAGGFLLARMFAPPAEADVSSYRYTPVATESGAEGFAAWSPDGQTIAYAAEVAGGYQIFTRRLDAPMPSQITEFDDGCLYPFWSSSGTRIFYVSGAPGEIRSLWSIGAAGGQPELVIKGASSAAISPDGKTLAFLRGQALWLAGPSGERATKFADFSAPAGIGFVRFSPDGKQIAAWIGSVYESSQLWIYPTPNDPTQPNLTPGRQVPQPWEATLIAGPRPFSWLPDNRQIVFEARPATSSNIHLWLADLESGATRALTTGNREEVYPAVSPDGQRIAFTAFETDSDIVEVPLDGSPPRPLLATPRYEGWPAWSAPTTQIAYSTNRNGANEIWVKSLREGWDRPLVTGKDFGSQPSYFLIASSFSPDGRRIAYERIAPGSVAIWISTVEGGPPVRPAVEPDDVRQDFPAWSPDGNWIVYLSSRAGKRVLAKSQVGGGATPVVLKDGMRLIEPQWSPKGDWIACVGDDGIMLVSPDGKQTQMLSATVPLSLGWSKDGTRMYGVKTADSRQLVLYELDVATRKERTLRDLGPAPVNPLPYGLMTTLRGFSLAPDGQSFAATIVRPKADIWILEGFARPGGFFERWRR